MDPTSQLLDSYIDGGSLEHWLTRPFPEVYNNMALVLRSPKHSSLFEDSNTCVDILLTCYCVSGGVAALDRTGAEDGGSSGEAMSSGYGGAVAQLVKTACLRHPNICSTLFHHFQSIPDVADFVHILPSVMLVCPNYKVNDLFDILLSLSENSENTVHVLSILMDIDLNLVRKQKVIQLVEDILCSTSETDFPPLFKLIFANLNLFTGSSLIRKLRSEISMLSVDSVVVLLFESMIDTMPYFSSVARMILTDILSDDYTGEMDRAPVSLFDAVVVLIALSMPVCSGLSRQVLQCWLRADVFPRDALAAIMERKAAHELWRRLIPSVRKLLSWLFDVTSSGNGFKISSVQMIKDLYVAFYQYNPEYRESVLSHLLDECFSFRGMVPMASVSLKQIGSYRAAIASKAHSRGKEKHATKAKVDKVTAGNSTQSVHLAAIGEAVKSGRGSWGASARHIGSTTSEFNVYEQKLGMALDIIEGIFHLESRLELDADYSASKIFLGYVLDRLRPDAQGTGGRNRLKLPPPVVLLKLFDKFIQCDARRMAGGNVSNILGGNTTMITVQKLIGHMGSHVDHTLLQVFHLVRAGDESLRSQDRNTAANRPLSNRSRVEAGSNIGGKDEIAATTLDNLSAQAGGIMLASAISLGTFGPVMSTPPTANISSQAYVPASSSGASSSRTGETRSSPTDKESHSRDAVGGYHRAHFLRESSSIDSWIGQYSSRFTDSSIFYAIDYFVSSLEYALSSDAACSVLQSGSLIASCEGVVGNILKSSHFIERGTAHDEWQLGGLASECVDMAVRTSASSTSWGVVNELTSLMLSITSSLAKLLSLLDIAKSLCGSASSKARLKSLQIAHSREYLSIGDDEETSAGTARRLVTRAGRGSRNRQVGGNVNKGSVRAYPISSDEAPIAVEDREILEVQWVSCEAEYCTADSEDGDQRVTTNLRLAWEYALTASALVGAQAAMTALSGGNLADESLLAVLHGISCSREYMRRAAPFTIEQIAMPTIRRTDGQGDRSHQGPQAGDKRKRRDLNGETTPHDAMYDEKTIMVLRKNTAMECHNKQIQRWLDRLVAALPAHHLLRLMTGMSTPLADYACTVENADLHAMKNNVTYTNSYIFSAAGFAATTAYVSHYLPPLKNWDNLLPQTTIHCLDLFVSRAECSSAMKRRQELGSDRGATDDAFAWTVGGSWFVMILPQLVRHSEALLLYGLGDGDAEDVNHAQYGNLVDYSSRSALLCAVTLLARQAVAAAWDSIGMDTDNSTAFLASRAVRELCAAEADGRNREEGSVDTESKFLTYMAKVERSCIESRDALMGLCGLSLLVEIAKPCIHMRGNLSSERTQLMFNGSEMHRKLVGLAWQLSSGLQSAFTVTTVSRHAHMHQYVPVGKGILFAHISAFIAEAQLLREVLEVLGHRDNECALCYVDVLDLIENHNKSKLKLEEYFFAKFWGSYWALEFPFYRLLGTHIAISQVFSVLLKPPLQGNINPSRKSRAGADMSTQNTGVSPVKTLFGRIDQDNVSDYFRILTAFFPPLFLSSSPESHPSHVAALGLPLEQAVVNPFYAFGACCSLFRRVVREYAALLDGSAKKNKRDKVLGKRKSEFFFRGLNYFSKMCKNSLVAIAVWVNRAVEWRNAVSITAPPINDFSNLEASAGDGDDALPDKGSLEYLAAALKLSIACSREVSSFISAVYNIVLNPQESSKRKGTRGAVKSLPMLEQTCEKITSHVTGVLNMHGIRSDIDIDEDGDQTYHDMFSTASSRYLSNLQRASNVPFHQSSWEVLVASREEAPARDFNRGSNEPATEDDDVGPKWHIPSADGVEGWGIYNPSFGSNEIPYEEDIENAVVMNKPSAERSMMLPKKNATAVISDEDSFDTETSSTDGSKSSSGGFNRRSEESSFDSSYGSDEGYYSDVTISDDDDEF